MKKWELERALISEVKPNITSDHLGNKIQIKSLFIDGLPETNPKPWIKVPNKSQAVSSDEIKQKLASMMSPQKRGPKANELEKESSIITSVKADEKNLTTASGFIDKKIV